MGIKKKIAETYLNRYFVLGLAALLSLSLIVILLQWGWIGESGLLALVVVGFVLWLLHSEGVFAYIYTKLRPRRKISKLSRAACGVLMILGVALMVFGLLDWATGSSVSASVASGLPAEVSPLVSPLAVGTVGASFLGLGLLGSLGLCGLCAMCFYSGVSPAELVPIRRFRDEVLRKSLAGRIFVAFYYWVLSPLFILFILILPFEKMKRELGRFLIPRLSKFCKKFCE